MITFFNSNQKSDPQFISSREEWLLHKSGKWVFDTWLGSGTLVYGHEDTCEKFRIDMLPDGLALNDQLKSLVDQLVDFELGGIGLQTSGSSAITRAVRLARTITKRSKIAVIGSFWHGSENEFLFKNERQQISLGVPAQHQSEVEFFADIADFEECSDMESFAALLVEPNQGADPSLPLLRVSDRLRELLKEQGVLLICDEIITGFRERYGSCNASRKSEPDIVVFGKALALGFPIGLVLVRKEALSGQQQFPFWGGTFASSPTQLERMQDSLQKLQMLDYQTIKSNHEKLVQFISPFAHKHGYTVKSGCCFSRVLGVSGGGSRQFLSKADTFVELQTELLENRVFLGYNALVFPSIFNIKQSLSSDMR